MTDLLGLLVANGCFLAAGIGVTGLAGWWSSRAEIPGCLGVSYIAGLAGFGVIAQLLYVLGAGLSRGETLIVCGLLALGSARALRRGDPDHVPPAFWTPALVGAALFFALLAVDLWYQPLWAYDAWTFWTPKAHALFALNGLDAQWFGAHDLSNRDYPLLLPALESATFRFTGYETRLLDLQSWVILAAFLLAVVEVGRRLRGREVMLGAVILSIALAPSVADQLASAEADIPVAVFFAASGLCAVAWLEHRRVGTLALAALLAAGAAATKVEGTIFVIALFAALAFLERRAPAPAIVAGGSALAAGIVPWRLWMAVHHIPAQVTLRRLTSPAVLLDHIGRVPHAAAYVGWKTFDPRAWMLLAPLCVAVLILGRRDQQRVFRLAVAAAGLAFAGLLLAYWTTPLPFDYHLATSARRVITGPVFLVAALLPLVARRPDEASRDVVATRSSSESRRSG